MSNALARATRSLSRDNPSSRLYSLWVCRWTKFLAMTLPHVCAARGSAAACKSLPLRASLGRQLLLEEANGGDQILSPVERREHRVRFVLHVPLSGRQTPTRSVMCQRHECVFARLRQGQVTHRGHQLEERLDRFQEVHR